MTIDYDAEEPRMRTAIAALSGACRLYDSAQRNLAAHPGKPLPVSEADLVGAFADIVTLCTQIARAHGLVASGQAPLLPTYDPDPVDRTRLTLRWDTLEHRWALCLIDGVGQVTAFALTSARYAALLSALAWVDRDRQLRQYSAASPPGYIGAVPEVHP